YAARMASCASASVLALPFSSSLRSNRFLSLLAKFLSVRSMIYTLSLRDALPILQQRARGDCAENEVLDSRLGGDTGVAVKYFVLDRKEHTSELQSPDHLVCRLLLEKNKHK